jgi:hypothetical protein
VLSRAAFFTPSIHTLNDALPLLSHSVNQSCSFVQGHGSAPKYICLYRTDSLVQITNSFLVLQGKCLSANNLRIIRSRLSKKNFFALHSYVI